MDNVPVPTLGMVQLVKKEYHVKITVISLMVVNVLIASVYVILDGRGMIAGI
tara:strand:+ start:4310 stop:4465 length:156 start_codon:yes stop_codon:yes gene_type:complete